MPDFSPFALAATALAATLAGIMLFFAAVVTPAVFKTLERAEAGQVVRTLFPKYYVLGTVLAATAAGLAGIAHPDVRTRARWSRRRCWPGSLGCLPSSAS